MWSFTESSVLSPSWCLPVGGEAVTFTPGLGHASTDGFLQPMTGLQWKTPGRYGVWAGIGACHLEEGGEHMV